MHPSLVILMRLMIESEAVFETEHSLSASQVESANGLCIPFVYLLSPTAEVIRSFLSNLEVVIYDGWLHLPTLSLNSFYFVLRLLM